MRYDNNGHSIFANGDGTIAYFGECIDETTAKITAECLQRWHDAGEEMPSTPFGEPRDFTLVCPPNNPKRYEVHIKQREPWPRLPLFFSADYPNARLVLDAYIFFVLTRGSLHPVASIEREDYMEREELKPEAEYIEYVIEGNSIRKAKTTTYASEVVTEYGPIMARCETPEIAEETAKHLNAWVQRKEMENDLAAMTADVGVADVRRSLETECECVHIVDSDVEAIIRQLSMRRLKVLDQLVELEPARTPELFSYYMEELERVDESIKAVEEYRALNQ